MSFGTGAGKGDLPRAVKGEAFRAAYDSIKKPEPLAALLVAFNKATDERDTVQVEALHSKITQHPYYRGKL
jgi:hypothetical protein